MSTTCIATMRAPGLWRIIPLLTKSRAARYRLMLELSAESHNHHGAGHALDNLPLSHAAIARDRRKYPQSANAELQLYEFGCKVSITTPVTSPKGGQFVLHAKALYDNPTMATPLILQRLVGVEVRRIHVDKGYRGHSHPHRFRV
jgi:hypothetical protein